MRPSCCRSTRSTTRDGPVSDAEGRIAFPALIPGATYRVIDRPRGGPPTFRKDFTVKPGETVDLGDILIEKPLRDSEATSGAR